MRRGNLRAISHWLILWLATAANVECFTSEARKLADCENGTTKEYFDEKFTRSNKMGGETFDSYCYTNDLYFVNCCLEDWMGDNDSVITSYTIYELRPNRTASPATWIRLPFTGNSTISRNGKCVIFPAPVKKCRVQIYYTRDGSDQQDRNKGLTENSESSGLADATYIFPVDSYSFQYNIDQNDGLSSIKRTGNVVNITVRTPEFHSLITSTSQWQMCYCIISSNVQNKDPLKQCNVDSKYSRFQQTLVKEVKVSSLPQDRPFNICVAITKELFGSFSYRRLCKQLDLTEESNSALMPQSPSQVFKANNKNRNQMTTVTVILAVVCVLLIGTVTLLSVRNLWKDCNEKQSTPEEESDYENPNYSLGGACVDVHSSGGGGVRLCNYLMCSLCGQEGQSALQTEKRLTVVEDGQEAYRNSSSSRTNAAEGNHDSGGNNTSSGYRSHNSSSPSSSSSDSTSSPQTTSANQSEHSNTNLGNMMQLSTMDEVRGAVELNIEQVQSQLISQQRETKWKLRNNRLGTLVLGAIRRNKNDDKSTDEVDFNNWYERAKEWQSET